MAGDFECNSCARARGLAEVTADCGATLIVCPTPILEQWREETAKHLHEGVGLLQNAMLISKHLQS